MSACVPAWGLELGSTVSTPPRYAGAQRPRTSVTNSAASLSLLLYCSGLVAPKQCCACLPVRAPIACSRLSRSPVYSDQHPGPGVAYLYGTVLLCMLLLLHSIAHLVCTAWIRPNPVRSLPIQCNLARPWPPSSMLPACRACV